MPKEHNQLDYATRMQRGIRLAAGLGVDSEGVTRLSESWQPILNPYERPEFANLLGDRLVWASGRQGAVAGQVSAVGLRNPSTSQVLCTLEWHTLFAENATRMVEARQRVQSATGVLSTASPFGRDSRFGWTGAGGAALLLTGANAAAATFGSGPVARVVVTTTVTLPVPFPVVIHPGQEFWWVWTTVNEIANVSFQWRETRILPGQTPR